MKDMRLWVDIETTGLDANKGGILEVGIILTDKFGGVEAEGEWLVNPYSDIDVVKAMCNSTVRDMHTKSCLFDDLEDSENVYNYMTVQNEIEAWMKDEGIPTSALPMCGSSVHFDRSWLKHHLPIVESLFTYRNIDVSTLRELCKDLNPAVYEAMSEVPKMEEHRALPDLEDTINLYRFMLDNFLFVAV